MPRIARAETMARAKIGCELIYKRRNYSKRETSPKTMARTPGTPLPGHSLTQSSLLHRLIINYTELIFICESIDLISLDNNIWGQISGHVLDIYLILSGWPVNIVYIVLSAGRPLGRLKHHIVIILSSYLTCIWTEGAQNGWSGGHELFVRDAPLGMQLKQPIFAQRHGPCISRWKGATA